MNDSISSVLQDSLVEKTSEGKFVPQGRRDILAEAIDRPEHPGRVRAVGGGVGIRQYFGPISHDAAFTPFVLNSKQIEAIKTDLREQLMRDISSIPAFSQLHPNFQKSTPSTNIPASTKGSCCAVPSIPEDEEEEDIPEECELYVDNNHHIVAYANVYKLGPTIHNQLLDNDMVRVAVTKVLVSNVQVPMPTDEVTMVGEALNTFIQWPKRLLRLVSNKVFILYVFIYYTIIEFCNHLMNHNYLCLVQNVKGTTKDDLPSKRSEPEISCAEKLMLKVLKRKEHVTFELDENNFFYLPTRDIMELCMSTEDLCYTILRVWMV